MSSRVSSDDDVTQDPRLRDHVVKILSQGLTVVAIEAETKKLVGFMANFLVKR